MTEGTVHVVGAGLAGLSAALCLATRGRRVRLWEAAGHAGGRCRSFHDATLDRTIDNGSHLVLTGNASVRAHLARAGAPDALVPAPEAAFPFADLETGARFTVRMNRGPLPWWVLNPARRVPGTRPADYLAGARLIAAPAGATVADRIADRGALWRGFWEPLTLGVLNTTPERGQARLLGRVLLETFAKGAGASRPMFAPQGLGAALVEPAVVALRRHGAAVEFGAPLKALETDGGRLGALVFARHREALGPDDSVVLALPPSRLRALLPELDPPEDTGAILNAHFVVPDAARLAGKPPLLGLLGALGQWIFVRGDVVSVTVSAADAIGATAIPREEVADRLWREVQSALELHECGHIRARIIVEKRATFDQSPAGVAKRLNPRTRFANLVLAGDATDTGLPATIEGAIRSGETAAELAA